MLLAFALQSKTGSVETTGTAPLSGEAVYAALEPGSDCSAKVAYADSNTPATIPIVVDESCGGVFSIPVTLSPGRVLRFVQYGTYTLKAPITLGYASVVEGLPMASNGGAVSLREGSGANLACMICMTGANSVIVNLLIDAEKSQQTSARDGVLVSDANRVHIHDVTIRNAERDNIHVTNRMYPTVAANEFLALNEIVTLNVIGGGVALFNVTAAGTGTATYPECSRTSNASCAWGTAVLTNRGSTHDNESGDGYLGPNVLLEGAGRDAFYTERNADWIVSPQVEFEASGRDGFHCEDCATYRFSGDDFASGAGGGHGFYVAAVNAQCSTGIPAMNHIVVGSQFGGNPEGDIYVTGNAAKSAQFCSRQEHVPLAGGMTITGNSFIGAGTSSPEDSITFIDAGGNSVSGNTWGFLPWSQRYRYIVNSSFSLLTGSQRSGSVIGNNSFVETASGAIYTGATPFSLTMGVDVATASTAQGTEVEWKNKILNGAQTVNGAIDVHSAVTAINGTNGTANCSEGLQGEQKMATCYLNGYAQNGTAQSYTFPTTFSATPVLLESGGSCGAFNPSVTATMLILPASAAMKPETCNVVVMGQ